MATIDIPSLPSTDLNNMVSLFLKPPPGKQTRILWPGATTVPVVEDCGDTDRSPEPRTPKFGVTSTPTFEESNAHFGFQFPRSSDSSNMAAVSSRVSVTNVSVFVSEADSNTTASRQPHHEVMESEATVDEEPAQYVIVQEDNLDSQLNIPTTVLDEVRESSSSDKMQSGKVKRSDLPTIMLASGDGKPASFIRFLNDPIPLPVQYEHQELNIDKYRKPVEDSFETVPSGSAHQRLIADLDAIQRMEQDPVYPETKYIHFTPDQSVPQADQTSGSEQYTTTDNTSSDDSSSNSAPVYHHDPDAMISEVAAYQCVDETPTYTELTTRPPSPTPGICQQQPEDQLLTYSQFSEGQTGNQTQGFSDSYLGEGESNSSAYRNTSTKLNLKDELKNKIQLKRLKEGKGELKVSFENRPIGEPSEEEKMKAEVRKQKNRESAVKSREKRQKLLEYLEKEVKALERENKQLVREIGKLREANIQLSNFDCDCVNTVTNPEYPTTDVASDHGEDAGSQDFQKALSEFLARQDNT